MSERETLIRALQLTEQAKQADAAGDLKTAERLRAEAWACVEPTLDEAIREGEDLEKICINCGHRRDET